MEQPWTGATGVIPIPLERPGTTGVDVNSSWLGSLGDWVDGALETASSVASSWFDWKTSMTQMEATTALANAEAAKAQALNTQATGGVNATGTSNSLPAWVLPVGAIVAGGLLLLMVVSRK